MLMGPHELLSSDHGSHGKLHGTRLHGKGQQQTGTYHFEEAATEAEESVTLRQATERVNLTI